MKRKIQNQGVEPEEETNIGWCWYCKGSVRLGDDFIVKKGKMYHLFCFYQMNDFVPEVIINNE